MEELRYISCNPDAIWNRGVSAYIAAGGDVLYPGDEKEMLMRAWLALSVHLLTDIDNGLRMATLRHSVDQYLDVIGEDRSCDRMEDTAATGTVQIVFLPTGTAQIIPAGTQMTADGVRFYETTEDMAQTGYAQTVSVPIRCTEAGALGNGLTAGTVMQLSSANPAVQSIIVTGTTMGGNDREDDESYRERIRSFGTASTTTGPSGMYEAQALAVSSEILSAKAVRLSAGSVGVFLLFADGADSENLIAAVTSALSDRRSRPLTDYVHVAEAETLNYTLDVHYVLAEDANAETAQAVAQMAQVYQAWQDNTIGRAFNPDWLISRMYQAGAVRVNLGESSRFNGGEAVYTVISNQQRCTGEITLTQEASI